MDRRQLPPAPRRGGHAQDRAAQGDVGQRLPAPRGRLALHPRAPAPVVPRLEHRGPRPGAHHHRRATCTASTSTPSSPAPSRWARPRPRSPCRSIASPKVRPARRSTCERADGGQRRRPPGRPRHRLVPRPGLRPAARAVRGALRPVARPAPAAHLGRRRSWPRRSTRWAPPCSCARPTSCAASVLDRPLRVIGSTRGDPTNVDVAGGHGQGHPGAAHAGPQRRRRGRADGGPAAGRHPPRGRRRPRRAGRRPLPRRIDPLPALPGLADRRSHRGAGGPRRRRPRREVAARRARA